MTEANKYPAHEGLVAELSAIAKNGLPTFGFNTNYERLITEFQSLLFTQAVLEADNARLRRALEKIATGVVWTDFDRPDDDGNTEGTEPSWEALEAKQALASLNSTNKGDV